MTSGPAPIDDPLLYRFLAGEASPAEIGAVQRWIDAEPVLRGRLMADLASAVQQMGDLTSPSIGDIDVEAFAQRLDARIAQRPSPARRSGHLSDRHTLFWRSALVAAVLVLVIGAGWITHWSIPERTRVYATTAGQRLSVTLDDGTRMVLAPASHLGVSHRYGQGHRTVDLDGEAYFSVVHNAAHPFAVRTHDATVTDVGTEFDVSAYAGDEKVRVAVAQGRVSVARAVTTQAGMRPTPVLSVGDMAIVDSAGITITHNADIMALTAWRQGRLVFDQTPLSDVIAQIARTYNLDIVVADSSLRHQAITASFGDAPATAVLDALTRVMGARYERAGRRVTIRRGLATLERPSATPPKPLQTARLTSTSTISVAP